MGKSKKIKKENLMEVEEESPKKVKEENLEQVKEEKPKKVKEEKPKKAKEENPDEEPKKAKEENPDEKPKKAKEENPDEKPKKAKEENSDEKPKKAKEENPDESQVMEVETEEISYEEKLNYVSVIAQPMAPKKLAGRIYRLIKKASQHKTYLRNGLKDVQNRIRKGERGIVIFAGDISPVEVIAHLPAVCEEKELPYIYTPSKQDLGSAMGVKRGFLIVLIRENDEYKQLYDKVLDEINKVPKVF